ncbi:MAG: hypothetical protein ACREFZ_01840 [Acetobacteraceae bacterium]
MLAPTHQELADLRTSTRQQIAELRAAQQRLAEQLQQNTAVLAENTSALAKNTEAVADSSALSKEILRQTADDLREMTRQLENVLLTIALAPTGRGDGDHQS